jgi:NO-binding membrane sensor protein with MHYT domain
MSENVARNRYFAMVGVQLIAVIGAVFGLVLAGRATSWEQSLLGGAILLAGLYVMAVVPRAMARKWRTPPPEE